MSENLLIHENNENPEKNGKNETFRTLKFNKLLQTFTGLVKKSPQEK